MRKAVRQGIIDVIPELDGRIYDVFPPAGMDDSFAVITLGEDVWKSSWAGYRQVIRLKLYAGSADLSKLDAWAVSLMKGLHRKRVIGLKNDAYKLHYLGVPEADKFDSATGKVMRMIRFGIYVPEPSEASSPEQPDEWLSVVAGWTSSLLGNPWTVYHTAWPVDRDDYAMLWRLTGCETKMVGASMYEIRKSFTGHIASPVSENDQLTAIRLVEEFGGQLQLLDSDNRRYLSVLDASSNLQADPILEGQLTLTLVQRKMRSVEEAALIRRVNIHPILK